MCSKVTLYGSRGLRFTITASFLLTSILQGNTFAADELEFFESMADIYVSGDTRDLKIRKFELLLDEAAAYRDANPGLADAVAVQAIVLGNYIGFKGGNLGSIKQIKQIRDDLSKIVEAHPDTLDGYAMAYLGSLYHYSPPWPISFGSDKKAGEYLMKALEYDDHGQDVNYEYGVFLIDEGRKSEAKLFLEKAGNAGIRENRKAWDSFRHFLIDASLSRLE